MNYKNLVIIGLIVLVLVFGTLYYLAQSKVSALIEQLGGAGSGQTFYTVPNFLQGFTSGVTNQFEVSNGGQVIQGGAYTIATNTVAFTNANLCSNYVVSHTNTNFLQGNSPTVYLPGATTTPCLGSTGDSLQFLVRNTSATTTVLISGAYGGNTLVTATTSLEANSQATSVGNTFRVPTSTVALIRAIRTSASAVTYLIQIFR